MLSGMHDALGRALSMIFGPLLAVGAVLVLWAILTYPEQSPSGYGDPTVLLSLGAIVFVGFIGVSMTLYAFRKHEKKSDQGHGQ